MIISIASGKGGTGKTTVSTNLSSALSHNYKVLILDCDAEEPNSHLFLKPEKMEQKAVSIPIPVIDFKRCNFCGKCSEVCEFNVFAQLKDDILIFKELCHGCGACSYFCPQKAINEENYDIGVVEFGKINGKLDFVHGKLEIGKPMVPPIISKVKEYIKSGDEYDYYIIDSPPGTSCPMVNTVNDSDYCILVTEPTPFGFNDLKLAVEVVEELKVPFGVIINKSDLGNEDVKNYCNQKNIPILMEIPFDKEIAKVYSTGDLIVEHFPEYKNKFINIISKIKQQISRISSRG